MVKYELFSRSSEFARYYYYVEGNTASEPGIIEVNLIKHSFEIAKASPNDFIHSYTKKKALQLLHGINEMRKENGVPLMTEEDFKLPKEDEYYYVYGSKAAKDIEKKILEEKVVPKSGSIIWY